MEQLNRRTRKTPRKYADKSCKTYNKPNSSVTYHFKADLGTFNTWKK